MYRILFTPTPPTAEEARRLLDEVLKKPATVYQQK
jgi:hypothetical protein